MKTDRLYAITLYLLNHGRTSAGELSEIFEVSVRTIQRDVDALCRAGVPVAAEKGVGGGYYIAQDFKMNAQTATAEDYSRILTALKGYSSAIKDAGVSGTLEKIEALAGKRENGVILDFSVLREGDSEIMEKVKTAITCRKGVSFGYTNSENISRRHIAEPIALVYRWYAWYLLAYCVAKDDYRTYKLARMDGLEITDAGFSREHESAEDIMRKLDGGEPRTLTQIVAKCRPEARAKALEYLNGRIIREHEDGTCDMTLNVIESEHMWFGTLLALGDGIKIEEPERIRKRLAEAAEKIVEMYREI